MLEKHWRKVSVKYTEIDGIGTRYVTVYDTSFLGTSTRSEIFISEDEVVGFLGGLAYKEVRWIDFPEGKTPDLEKRIEAIRLK